MGPGCEFKLIFDETFNKDYDSLDIIERIYNRVEDVHEHNTRFSRGLSIQYAWTKLIIIGFLLHARVLRYGMVFLLLLKRLLHFANSSDFGASTLDLINSYK